MNIYLTFDVEIWCDGWETLDQSFPRNFDRYVYGRSAKGEWALPKTLEILQRSGLRGIFFVEPLFSARFGAHYLERIVELIRGAGQDVQLHLHAEWTDEIRPPLIADCSRKRQHLSHYTLQEQIDLIAHGRRMLEAAGSGPITAFRAGSFAVNRDTYEALRTNRILIDSSPNGFYEVSGPDLRADYNFSAPFMLNGISVYPVTLFRDGLGKQRPVQVNGASFEEMQDALRSAYTQGVGDFVIVSHNFEMLKPGTTEPDPFVVRRFERLCRLLSQQAEYELKSFAALNSLKPEPPMPYASTLSTGIRYGEQLARRFA